MDRRTKESERFEGFHLLPAGGIDIRVLLDPFLIGLDLLLLPIRARKNEKERPSAWKVNNEWSRRDSPCLLSERSPFRGLLVTNSNDRRMNRGMARVVGSHLETFGRIDLRGFLLLLEQAEGRGRRNLGSLGEWRKRKVSEEKESQTDDLVG